CQHYYSIPSSC
nr:immunoglobulin light chain junction region [Macaca mulatta]